MAVSCPQCGAAVLAGTRTCQFCGAQVEYVEPTAAASALPAAEIAPSPVEAVREPDASIRIPVVVSPPGAEGEFPKLEARKPDAEKPAPKKRGSNWILMAVIGVFAVWLFIFVGYRLLSVVNPSSPLSGGAAQSTAAPASGTSADLGVDIFPGARPVSALDRRESTDSTVVTQAFVSEQKVDLVIDFYKARMVGQTSIYASGNGVVVSINPNPQDFIQVAIGPGGSAGATRIDITRTTSKTPR